MERLRPRLSADQIAEGQRRFTAFVPTTSAAQSPKLKTFSHCEDQCFQQFERFLVTVTAIPKHLLLTQKLYLHGEGQERGESF